MISFLGSTLASGGAVPQVVSNADPLPVILSGGLAGLAVAGTQADGSLQLAQFPVTIGGVDNATDLLHTLSTDATGALNVNLAGGGAVTVVQPTAANLNAQVVGNVASAVADSGNPVKVGGVFTTAPAVVANGQRVDLQLASRGFVLTNVVTTAGAVITGTAPADGAAGATGLFVNGQVSTFNGATWDRTAKPRTNFKLPASAATNNAANIKATPGTVYAISGFTALAAAGPYWLKFFDTTGVPNPAALAQFREFPLVALKDFQWLFPNGLYFPTGIGLAIVQGAADLNNVAVAAGDVLGLVVEFL